jgi:immune inhibitor A
MNCCKCQVDNMEPAVYPHSMEDRCLVAPHPEVRKKILNSFRELKDMVGKNGDHAILQNLLRPVERRPAGFNDGLLRPHSTFRPGTTLAAARAARVKPRGVNYVAVVLVDFTDRKFDVTQDVNFYNNLWFGIGTNSVRDYYRDVSHGLVDIQGQVVGPLRMPHSLKYYSDNQNGLGDNPPNARVMARDAAKLADKIISFTKYDNDGDGYVDAFVVVHAGQGAERTGLPTDIWSHKYVLDGGPYQADNTLIYAYLTVPADGKLGVCAHETGHLLFGWPDLYDADSSSAGIGSWCLMASGSYNGNGDNPAEPCAWCKVDQGWVTVLNITQTAM